MKVNPKELSEKNIESTLEINKKEILKGIIKFIIQKEALKVDETMLLQKFYNWLVEDPKRLYKVGEGNLEELAKLEFVKSITELNDVQNENYKKLLDLMARHIHQLMLTFLQRIKEVKDAKQKQEDELSQPKTETRFKIRSLSPDLSR